MLEDTTNPSAPKVPRRDNLAASDTNGQICQDWYSFSWGGGHVRPGEPPKSARDCGHSSILQIGRKSSKWTVSIQHGRNIAPAWGQLRPARPQLRPNLEQLVQLRPSLDPRWRNFTPTWIHLGATSAHPNLV